MSGQQERLQLALDAALHRYEDRVGAAFPADVELDVISSEVFYAAVYPGTDGIVVEVSTGVVDTIEETWRAALAVSKDMPEGSGIDLLGDPEHPIDMSLRWLMQHELNHYAIGHFALTGGAGLLEAGSHAGFGVVAQQRLPHGPLVQLSEKDRQIAHLCLELQTDHDASEIVLGAYATENWVLFRYYATCVVAVILLIEKEERGQRSTDRTHPWAATRLFMLLAHLVELPFLPAYFRAAQEGLESIPPEYLPDAEELTGYNREVVGRVFEAAHILAAVIGLSSLWEDLGSLDALVKDIDHAVSHGASDSDRLKTTGARQWAALKPLNDRLLQMIEPIGLPEDHD